MFFCALGQPALIFLFSLFADDYFLVVGAVLTPKNSLLFVFVSRYLCVLICAFFVTFTTGVLFFLFSVLPEP